MEAVKDPGSGRNEAIERMVKEWQLPLLRLCYIQLHDKALAEDAVQETFVKAFRGWTQFRGQSSEKTWLTKIAVNTCTDLQRGAWFRHTDRRVTPEMLPEASVPFEEKDSMLTLAVMQLPIRLREVILLHYYQGLNVNETAEVLGISQPSVSNRLKRGRERLREALEGRELDE